MSLQTKPELSKNNKYWISKHRHYELKRFCLQYPEWKKLYSEISYYNTSSYDGIRTNTGIVQDLTSKIVEQRDLYLSRIELVEETAKKTDKKTDKYLWEYILKGVTEGLPYNSLRMKSKVPCGRDVYYETCRKFFWLLDKARE